MNLTLIYISSTVQQMLICIKSSGQCSNTTRALGYASTELHSSNIAINSPNKIRTALKRRLNAFYNVKNSRIFTNFKTLSHEFSMYDCNYSECGLFYFVFIWLRPILTLLFDIIYALRCVINCVISIIDDRPAFIHRPTEIDAPARAAIYRPLPEVWQ